MKYFDVDVWGDLACFSRPEAKIERFSYPLITPSAARGILDAIYCKYNEFGWRIDQIEVMKPIRFIALRRNEVKDRISTNAVLKAMQGRDEGPIIVADDTKETAGTDQKGRTQRQTIALVDVHYRIRAHIEPRPEHKHRRQALEEQAKRRIEQGKCFYQPYLGCREFPAFFAPADMERIPFSFTQDLGYMLYDVFDLEKVVRDDARAFISLFHATVENGVMRVPAWDSKEVLKPLG